VFRTALSCRLLQHGKSKEGDERSLVSKAQDEVLEIGAELARCRKQLEEAQERLRLSEEAQGKMKELEEAQERVKQLNSHLEDAKGVQQKMLRREADLLDEVEKLRGAAHSGATDAGNPDKVWCESCQILKEEVREAKEVVEREAGRAQSLQSQLSDAQADLRRMRSEVEMQAGRAQVRSLDVFANKTSLWVVAWND
jgi:chromosome segregation ATPase